MAELGRAALALSLGLSLWAFVAGAYAARRGRRRLAASARNALVVAFGTTLVASVVLVAGFVGDDFSLAYVAGHSSEALPTRYKLSAFWGGQEGSLLLWLLVLTGYGALAVRAQRRRSPELAIWTTPVLGAICVGFAWLLVGVSSPFVEILAPADGRGLNPSLQNPYMVAHPVFLYLGYVGLAVPFAFAMGSLLAGRVDEAWVVATRRWTIVAWTALGVGQLLGAKWAYEEVGWGGYYAWDAVENAALMPWIVATAYLHSVMVQEKRGMLRVWNVALVSAAFCLSLFGTFLTRSGVINSIHSFTLSTIGPWFLALVVIAVVASVALIWLRLPQLRTVARLESLVSREATFLYNNLLLVALALTILWGTTWPMVSEAIRGETVVVGRPYFDFFVRVLGLPLLLLMGIGPLVAWRRSSLRSVARTFAIPAAFALAAGIALIAAGAGSSIPGLIGYTFAAFALASIVHEFVRGTVARRSLTGDGLLRAFAGLVARNRRRYGGYVVHAAIVMLAVGIIGSSAYDSVAERRLAVGDRLEVGGYDLAFRRLVERESANATEVRAVFDLRRGDASLGSIAAGKNAYTVEEQVSNEVGIRSDLLRAEDLFVIVEQVNEDGSVHVRAFVKPLVNLIWLAGFVFVIGSLVTLWPDRREERRLAARARGVSDDDAPVAS